MANLLPEDVLTNIISRLPPRYLAVSRCVCKTWCAIIDACNMLRADLLPHSVSGIFINFRELPAAEFFSRPSKGPMISGYFDDFLPHRSTVHDHCNGLLLLHEFVVNPATRQCARLPPCPSRFWGFNYLVFDPTLSPHYEVFVLPSVHCYEDERLNRLSMLDSDVKYEPAMEELEWPPSPYVLPVFSSRTKEWEERSFVREGEAAAHAADLLSYCRLDTQRNAVFWRQVLYVNCQTRFIMRISLSNANYQVIKPPESLLEYLDTGERDFANLYLGKSEKGVYCALDNGPHVFRIYILDESSGKMDWVSKDSCYFSPILPYQRIDEPGPWTLQHINHLGYCSECDEDIEEATGEKFEWDSDSDNVIGNRSWREDHFPSRDACLEGPRYFTFLGFHPYKEIVFVCDTLRRGLAYHLNISKLQDLGSLKPVHYGVQGDVALIERSFPYTPWIGELPDGVN